MALVLSVLRCPDHAVPETRRLTGGELCIGRDPLRAQWVLPDPTQQISRQHCTLRFDNGVWQVLDTSANGTFMNQATTPLGQGAPRTLKNGDRLRIGPYEIEARLEEAAFAPAPPASPPSWGGSLFPEHPAPPADPFDAPEAASPFGVESIALPDSFLQPDPFAAPPAHAPPAATPDHTPSFTDAFPPARPLLSDDWAKEFEFHDPFAAPAAADPFGAARVPEPLLTPVPPAALEIAAPFAAPPPVTVPASAAPGSPAASDSALIAAFMAGAGLPDLAPQDPEAAMRAAGAAFRAFVTGLRELLIVRAEVKDTMGIDKTYIRARDNNPLKFSAGDDDALTALLGTGRRVAMAPATAVAEALRDIRMHEQAIMPAMQAAIRALMARLDPDRLRAASDGGGLALPAQRRARAWDQFEAEYARVIAGLADDFDTVFGRRFAEEYERIVADLRAGEAP
jgi:type VI secretion system protein ImpI/type VI secretion system protein